MAFVWLSVERNDASKEWTDNHHDGTSPWMAHHTGNPADNQTHFKYIALTITQYKKALLA